MTLAPQHLHALAALRSLAAAWPRLLRAVEAAAAFADGGGDLGTLRSPTWSSGRSGGGYSNAVLDAVASAHRTRWTTPEQRLMETTAGTVRWLGDALLVGGAEPRTLTTLIRLQTVVPRRRVDQVTDLTRWIGEADRKIRTALQAGDDHQLLTGATCPACGVRRIAVRTSAPDVDARPYVCEAESCVCAGEGCPCGMAVRPAGVRHIWLRADLVAAIRGRGDER